MKTVMVDGQLVKEDGRLKANLAKPRDLVEESADFLMGHVDKQEHWQRPVTTGG